MRTRGVKIKKFLNSKQIAHGQPTLKFAIEGLSKHVHLTRFGPSFMMTVEETGIRFGARAEPLHTVITGAIASAHYALSAHAAAVILGYPDAEDVATLRDAAQATFAELTSGAGIGVVWNPASHQR